MSSGSRRVVTKEDVIGSRVKQEKVTRWADLVDDGDERKEMDMSLLAEAIQDCEIKEGPDCDMSRLDEDMTCEQSHARALSMMQREKRASRDQPGSRLDVIRMTREGASIAQKDSCSDRVKSSNGDECDAEEMMEGTDMGVNNDNGCGVAGKTPQRMQMHHVGDGVTSLCKTIQFVKVGNLPRPVKYRHKLPKEQKYKSDPNRWLKEALVDTDAFSNTAGKAVPVEDRRAASRPSTLMPREALNSASVSMQPSPWDRRREAFTRILSSPLSRMSIPDQRGSSHYLREHSPSSTFAHSSPFASLNRRQRTSEGLYHTAEPVQYAHERLRDHHRHRHEGPSRSSELEDENSMTLMTSPLPPPNYEAFYRRQKELQREAAALAAYSTYDVPPHLDPLYTSNNSRSRIIHDSSLAVHPHQSSYPSSFRTDHAEREPYPPHPSSMPFNRRRGDESRPGRLPPNGEPYWVEEGEQPIESSSSGVRRDDVGHARSYSNTHNHPSDSPRVDIDLLKRGILNRTMKE